MGAHRPTFLIRQPKPRCCLLLLFLLGLAAAFIYALWYGMNSDRDNLPAVLNQLLPAGHCACKTSTLFECDSCLDLSLNATYACHGHGSPNPSQQRWTFEYGRDDRNEGLDTVRCEAAFPGLDEDVHRATKFWRTRGGLSPKHLDDMMPLRAGMARGMIYDGELYVLAMRARGEDHRRKLLAVLSSMYRALVADPERNLHRGGGGGGGQRGIEFVVSVEDKVEDVLPSGPGKHYPVWALARKAAEESLWLIPDFGLWAWDNPSNAIGPYSQVVESVIERENHELAFQEKEMRLVWRGKLSFAPKMRRALLEIARGRSWGDVKALDWRDKETFLSMEDHCRYMFIAHVEGRSYSASLKYRQACRSVVVAHKLQYIQHHHYLLRASGPHQNYVQVERDFSDLPAKIEALIKDPDAVRHIANNSVRTFRERYLTPAAEACYWRALWRGWAEIWTTDGEGKRRRGMRYESFLLLESRDMLVFPK